MQHPPGEPGLGLGRVLLGPHLLCHSVQRDGLVDRPGDHTVVDPGDQPLVPGMYHRRAPPGRAGMLGREEVLSAQGGLPDSHRQLV